MKSAQGYSENYYYNQREKIYKELEQLPQGTIKKRLIAGHSYYYLQHREGKKVIHKYIGKEISKDLQKAFQRREELKKKLTEMQDIVRGFLAAKIRSL